MKRKCEVSLFLDSGAFSANIRDLNIDIYKYMEFIKEHEQYLTAYANLDVIGDPEATWRNQKIMEDNGLSPLPVFHIEDGKDYLYRCFDYPYFCLGGMAKGFSKDQRISFMDNCFRIICDGPDHLPKYKVHGFGMTSLKLMLRYPWWSVDSTSWVLTGRFGSIFVPRLSTGGKYLYDDNPWKVTVSNRSPSLKDEDQHIESMTEMERGIILRYIEEKGYKLGKSVYRREDKRTYKLQPGERWLGKEEADANRRDLESTGVFIPPKDLVYYSIVEIVEEPGICNDYRQRDEMNVIYFQDLEKNARPWPWPFEIKAAGGLGMKTSSFTGERTRRNR